MLEYVDLFCNVAIPLMAVVGVTCVSGKTPASRRLGFIIGLAGQPLWYFTTAYHGQWGLFLASFWYTWRYVVGWKNNKEKD